jgi:hypothetical protein
VFILLVEYLSRVASKRVIGFEQLLIESCRLGVKLFFLIKKFFSGSLDTPRRVDGLGASGEAEHPGRAASWGLGRVIGCRLLVKESHAKTRRREEKEEGGFP